MFTIDLAHVNGEDWAQFALCLMIAVTGHLALHVYEIPVCMGIHTQDVLAMVQVVPACWEIEGRLSISVNNSEQKNQCIYY